MVSWTCPYCGKTMYSAWDRRTEEVVVCISCDGTFKNPYFRKEGQGNRFFKKTLSKISRPRKEMDFQWWRSKLK